MKWAYAEVVIGDWAALYFDGVLKWQGHTGDVDWPWWLSQGLPVEFVNLGYYNVDKFPELQTALPAD